MSIDVGNLDVKDDEDEDEEDEAGLPWLLSEKYDILVRKKEDHGKFQKAWSSRNQYMCWITKNQVQIPPLCLHFTITSGTPLDLSGNPPTCLGANLPPTTLVPLSSPDPTSHWPTLSLRSSNSGPSQRSRHPSSRSLSLALRRC